MPHFWYMKYDYDVEWDMELCELMENNRCEVEYDVIILQQQLIPIKATGSRVKIGNVLVDIRNYPYGFGRRSAKSAININFHVIKSHRPSRQTIYKFNKKVEQDMKLNKMSDAEYRNYKLNKIL